MSRSAFGEIAANLRKERKEKEARGEIEAMPDIVDPEEWIKRQGSGWTSGRPIGTAAEEEERKKWEPVYAEWIGYGSEGLAAKYEEEKKKYEQEREAYINRTLASNYVPMARVMPGSSDMHDGLRAKYDRENAERKEYLERMKSASEEWSAEEARKQKEEKLRIYETPKVKIGEGGETYEQIAAENRTSAEKALEGEYSWSYETEYMTEEERERFAYYYGTNRKEAEEYLDLLQEMRLYPKYREAKEKEGEAIAEEIEEIDSWLLRGLADVGLAIAGGVTDAVTGLANFGKMVLGEEDMIISSLSHANGLNIERVKEKSWMCGVLLEFTSGVTAAGLGIGVSIATGNPLAGAVVMGAQTSGNTYAREVASGKEADDARAYSLLVGIGTGTLQYLLGGIRAFGHSGGYGGKVAGKAGEALGGVVKQPVARSALNGIAKRMKEMGKEAFEEYVETTLEPVYRNLIYDEENKLELLSVEALENAFVGALTAGALNLILPESVGERNRTIEEEAALGGRRRRGNAELTDGQTDVDNALKRDIMGVDTEADSAQRPSNSENILWDSWQNYEKVFVDSHEYALVGKRLYSQHAVNRMQPSGNRFGPNIYQGMNGRDYGRSISPTFVEHIIRTVTPTIQENGNLMYASGDVRVITNKKGCVVTILTYMN